MANLGKQIVDGVKANIAKAWFMDSPAMDNLKLKVWQKKLVNQLMEKNYPSYTVAPKFNKRKKETEELIKQSKPWVARENLKELHKKFRRDNPNYHN